MAYNAPDPYRQAVRSSGLSLTFSVDATLGGVPVKGATGLAPSGGSITDTTKPGVRRVLTLDLPPAPGLFDALAPVGTLLTVTAHTAINGIPLAAIPCGVFDVDQQSVVEGDGKVTITAPDKWQKIVRAKFLGPQASTPGVLVTSQITYLIQGALGANEPVNVTATSLATMGVQTWDKDRDKAIIDLADGIGAWVYFDRNGVATIADVPKVGKSADWLIDASASGVLVSLDRQRSRTSTYNVVAVESSASSGASFPTQFCWDSDSSSPTYVQPGPWGPTAPTSASSPFGLVTYYFATPLPLDDAGARAAGGTVLSRTVGRASSVQMSAVPNPAIDAFDVLDVLGPRARYDIPRPLERHIVDTVTHPLDVTQPQTIQGRSTRTDAYT